VTLKDNLPTPHHPSHPDEWHHRYVGTMERVSQDGEWLFLVRGLAEDQALVYPEFKDVDMSYIRSLKTPDGTEDYDGAFARAEDNVIDVWRQLGSALSARDPERVTLVNGDLDTGMADRAAPQARQIFWA
jgi:hypothetical protein